jgi:hypothetical protein
MGAVMLVFVGHFVHAAADAAPDDALQASVENARPVPQNPG